MVAVSIGNGSLFLEWSGTRTGKVCTQPLGADGQLLVDQLAFVLPDGVVLHTRATYVLRRDGEEWWIAYSHLSLPRSS